MGTFYIVGIDYKKQITFKEHIFQQELNFFFKILKISEIEKYYINYSVSILILQLFNNCLIKRSKRY